MKTAFRKALAILAFASLSASITLGAQDLATILAKNKDNPRPAASRADMKLIIVNKAGQARERQIEAWSTSDDKVTKQLLEFNAPADVKGTRFLTITYEDPGKSDEQFFYSPALRKVRQIGTSGGDSKTGAFLGSDFTFADLGSLEDKDYPSKLLGKEAVNGGEYFKIEYVAANSIVVKNYGYVKVIRWINAATYTTWQNEYYDGSGKLVKRSTIEGQRLVDGYWLFDRIVMNNLESGGKSVWEFTKNDILKSVDDKYFTQRYLERGR